jgi:hypothetical protein
LRFFQQLAPKPRALQPSIVIPSAIPVKGVGEAEVHVRTIADAVEGRLG